MHAWLLVAAWPLSLGYCVLLLGVGCCYDRILVYNSCCLRHAWEYAPGQKAWRRVG